MTPERAVKIAMTILAAVLIAGILAAQTKRAFTVETLDLSGCDTVEITGPMSRLNISSGEYHAYWFKKYRDIERLTITCEKGQR